MAAEAGAFLAGAGLGLFFFAGLWWTVRRLPGARHPALLGLASLVARAAVLCGGIALVAGDRWERFVWALAGFILVRLVVVGRLGRMGPALAPRGGGDGTQS